MHSVLVDDEDKRYTLGNFSTLEAAIDACRKVVDRCLDNQFRPGMTAETLYDSYMHFGEEPFITGEPRSTFSAWDYAKERAALIAFRRG